MIVITQDDCILNKQWWNFLKLCKHIDFHKMNICIRIKRAMGQLYMSYCPEFSETPNPAYFYANFSCCTPKKSFRRFFRTPDFSISTCIITVNFSLCSDQRRRLGVKISYCQQIKKITKALRLSAWCLSENGRRGVHMASACRNSQSEARIWQWINTMSHVN